MTLRDLISNPEVSLDMQIGSMHSSGSTSSDFQVIYEDHIVVIPDQEDEDESKEEEKKRLESRIILLR